MDVTFNMNNGIVGLEELAIYKYNDYIKYISQTNESTDPKLNDFINQNNETLIMIILNRYIQRKIQLI